MAFYSEQKAETKVDDKFLARLRSIFEDKHGVGRIAVVSNLRNVNLFILKETNQTLPTRGRPSASAVPENAIVQQAATAAAVTARLFAPECHMKPLLRL